MVTSAADLPALTDPASAELLADAFRTFNQKTEQLRREYHRLRLEFVRVNRELEQRNRDLAASLRQVEEVRSHLESILGSLSMGVVACDREGHITLANAALEKLSGYSAGSLLGERCPVGFPRPAREFPMAEAAGPLTEGELVCATGDVVPVECNVAILRGCDGESRGWVSLIRDLRPIKKLEAQLARSETMAALGELAACVAHEVRNPLGGIGGFASLLKRSLDGEDPRARLVEKILDGVASVNRIVEDLLLLAKPVSLELRPVPLGPLLRRSMELALHGDRGLAPLDVTCDPGPEGLAALADPGPLTQAVVNLVRNAVEAMPRGGRLTVSANVGNPGEVLVTVADTGAGIAPEDRLKIFTPFFTTKEGGTGLGLSIVGAIMRAHGGSLDLASDEGQGTMVRLRLPGVLGTVSLSAA